MDIPISLSIDKSDLKRRFYTLSRQYHPDINSAQDPEAYVELLEKSGQVNDAYKTLLDDNMRLKHYLLIHNVVLDANETLSPSFLMEMMELNETVMELNQDAAGRTEVLSNLKTREALIQKKIMKIDEVIGYDKPGEQHLLDLKGLYFQQKYMLRIRKNLNSFVDE